MIWLHLLMHMWGSWWLLSFTISSDNFMTNFLWNLFLWPSLKVDIHECFRIHNFISHNVYVQFNIYVFDIFQNDKPFLLKITHSFSQTEGYKSCLSLIIWSAHLTNSLSSQMSLSVPSLNTATAWIWSLT